MEKKYEVESKPIEKREDGIQIQPLEVDPVNDGDGDERMTLTIVISICA